MTGRDLNRRAFFGEALRKVGVPICAVAIKLENFVSPIMGLPQIPNLAGMTWDQMLYWCRFIILHHG